MLFVMTVTLSLNVYLRNNMKEGEPGNRKRPWFYAHAWPRPQFIIISRSYSAAGDFSHFLNVHKVTEFVSATSDDSAKLRQPLNTWFQPI